MTHKKKSRTGLKLVAFFLPLLYPFNLMSRLLAGIINMALVRVKGYRITLGNVKFKLSGIYVYDIYVGSLVQTTCAEFSVQIKLVELKLNRTAFWNGIAEGKIFIENPVCKLLIEKTESPDDTNASGLPDIPFVIETFEISDGEMEFIDRDISDNVSVKVAGINLLCQNLTNIASPEELPAKAELHAAFGVGSIHSNIKFALNNPPAFDMNTEVKDIFLTDLNDVFLHYWKFRVQQGVLDVFMEAATENGKFKGYVKPLIQHLELSDEKQQPDGVLTWLKKTTIETLNAAFENKKEDQLATKVPIEGSFSNPKVNVFRAILETMYNGFVSALKPAIDHEINIRSVK